MGKILSKCLICPCGCTQVIKKELKRDKKVEIIYKQITNREAGDLEYGHI
jgi:hypothetical protein